VLILSAQLFPAAGTLAVLFSLVINSFSLLILFFGSFLIVIPKKRPAITAIAEFLVFTLFTAASGANSQFLPFFIKSFSL